MSDIYSKNQKEEILNLARERFKLCEESEQEIRALGLEDLEFRAGNQWPEQIKRERELDARPCLTINKMPQYVRQITNEQRQNRPRIKIVPFDDNADIKTAEVLQGIIRNIEVTSNAEAAYDVGFEGAAQKGFGFWRIVTEYLDEKSFKQVAKIKTIKNHFSVYLDPHAKEVDGSDANFGFIFEDISNEEFKKLYPDAELSKLNDWGNVCENWISKDTVRICEYFYKDFQEFNLVLLENGETFEEDKVPQELKKLKVLKTRKSKKTIVKWCKINGIDILEETIFPSKYIPIVGIYGDELNINGKKILESVIRHAKDPQRMYNFWKSNETETIALAPKAPYLATPKQIEGFENIWKDANRKNLAVLPYNAVTSGGQLIGAPQRNGFEPNVGAITQAAVFASEDIKATTGIYDASLGARSNETSGVAIRSRTAQAQTSNFHFIDNLSRSLRYTGLILIDVIQNIYDVATIERIIGEDGTSKMVKLNQEFEEDGIRKIYDINVGKYDVVVETGPSYSTKRQEAAASMSDLTRSYPQIMQVAGDLLVKNLDWPGAQDIAERLKKLLPPELQEKKDNVNLPPEVTAQMDQAAQMIESLQMQNMELQKKLENKVLELNSKEKIEFAKMDVDLTKKLAEIDSRDSVELLKTQIADLEQSINYMTQIQQMQYEQILEQARKDAEADFIQEQEMMMNNPQESEFQFNENLNEYQSPDQAIDSQQNIMPTSEL